MGAIRFGHEGEYEHVSQTIANYEWWLELGQDFVDLALRVPFLAILAVWEISGLGWGVSWVTEGEWFAELYPSVYLSSFIFSSFLNRLALLALLGLG
jgi:hypothetical protein